jgi:quercetin dioxygenase-like cupin family protein
VETWREVDLRMARMEVFSLGEMTGGWIAGDFEPCVLRTEGFEVAVKHYEAGATEASHHHKIAEEITVVAAGKVRMFNTVFSAGSIVRIGPGESTSFEALEPSITVVLKRPSVRNDKYID